MGASGPNAGGAGLPNTPINVQSRLPFKKELSTNSKGRGEREREGVSCRAELVSWRGGRERERGVKDFLSEKCG